MKESAKKDTESIKRSRSSLTPASQYLLSQAVEKKSAETKRQSSLTPASKLVLGKALNNLVNKASVSSMKPPKVAPADSVRASAIKRKVPSKLGSSKKSISPFGRSSKIRTTSPLVKKATKKLGTSSSKKVKPSESHQETKNRHGL